MFPINPISPAQANLSDFQEGQNSIIEISGPDNVDRLLEFLYTGEVDLSNLSNETNIMAVANELSVLGDFYLSDKMKTYAALVLGQYLGQYLNAICDVPGYAEIPSQYSVNGSRAFDAQLRPCSSLKLLGSDGIIHHLCDAIRDAYATPSGIHHVYVDFVCAARIRTFECPLIQALKDEIPEFCHDLLTAMMTGLQSSAFEGNKAFEKLKDPLFRTLAVDKVSRYPLDVDPIHDFDLTV